MKTSFTIILLLLVLNSFCALPINLEDSVYKIEEYKNLYQSGDYFFSGQPTYEALEWMKSQGIKKVINLRSESENEEFVSGSFNEEHIAKGFGMEYISIPMSGRGAYSPETLEKFKNALEETEGKVLIHCAGAGRVTYVMMAYLIKYQDYSIEKAVEFGKQVRYFNYLEALLGEEIYMAIKDE
jgi:uncharacterized protein (TIGR01244 family)